MTASAGPNEVVCFVYRNALPLCLLSLGASYALGKANPVAFHDTLVVRRFNFIDARIVSNA